MAALADRRAHAAATALRDWWRPHRSAALATGTVLMVLAAVPRLAFELWRLLWSSGPNGAIDLKMFHSMVARWFAGVPIYEGIHYGDYPPASYVLLWPLLGWLAVPPARWLWAALSAALLAWLIAICVRGSEATTSAERRLVALLPLAMYATNVAIGNGQIILHTLTPLLAGILLLRRSPSGWRDDAIAALLILFALVKPSVSAPFFWLALVIPSRRRPAALVIAGYAALTVLAATFQTAGLVELFRGWLAMSERTVVSHGHANIHIWLTRLGASWLMPFASLILLLSMGVWSHRYRRADVWLMLGVAGLVARLWTYHGVYDDALVLPAMVALFRIARRGPLPDGSDAAAGLLFAINWALALAPASLLVFRAPWPFLFELALASTWIATLASLMIHARADQRADAQPPPLESTGITPPNRSAS
jgi:glycosyl transferase family 87